jgi:tetratricopeptide (TPR) repeat protein
MRHARSLGIVLAALFAAALTLIPAAAQENCVSSVNYLQQGSTAYAASDFNGAVAAYTCALQSGKNPAAIYNYRGNAYRQLGDYARAVEDYTNALKAAPASDIVLNNRGWAYYRLGQYQLALADFNAALAINPKLASARNNRGLAYARLGKMTEALADFQEAVTLGEKPAEWAAINQANLGKQSGSPTAEPPQAPTAVAPADFTQYVQDAVVAYQSGDYEKTITLMSKAIELEPRQDSLLRFRADVYVMMKQYDLAIQDFSKAIELNPNYAGTCGCPPYRLGRAYVYALAGQADKAQADIDWVRRNMPGNRFLPLVQGEVYEATGDAAKAAVNLKQWIDSIQTEQIPLPAPASAEPFTVDMQPGRVYTVRFWAKKGQVLNVKADATAGDHMDPLIVLLDHHQQAVAGSDDHDGINAAVEGFVVPEDCNYTLVISHGNGGKVGQVAVSISLSG